MKKILVAGSCGYIGSHTLVDLLDNGFEVVSVDNFCRSHPSMLEAVKKITGKSFDHHAIDLCDADAVNQIFNVHPDINGIIHFAAYKFVEESVQHPLMYFQNNLQSLMNLLDAAQSFHIPHFVFSSSCTVYGNPEQIPVTENSPFGKAQSPYGVTKQIGETIVETCSQQDQLKSILLRYFNPVGAHPSGLIGEWPLGKPSNLVPAITQTAIGKIPAMQVHGNDYPTKDGSCLRDYIHVCDIAHAHTLALQYLMEKKNTAACETFNLGSGTGHTVLEVIKSFEKVTGISLNYSIGPRRAGDVVAIYANNNKAMELLQWKTSFNLDEMMQTAWNWELNLQKQKTNQ